MLCYKSGHLYPLKNDARQMFEITFGQWEANVKQISKLGLAQSEYASPLELSLIADVPMGRLITTPTYATKDGLPKKLLLRQFSQATKVGRWQI